MRPARAAVVGIGQSAFAKQLGMTEAEVAAVAIARRARRRRPRDSTTSTGSASTTSNRPPSATSRRCSGCATCASSRRTATAAAPTARSSCTPRRRWPAGHASVVLTFRARNRGRRSSFGKGYTEGGRPWEKIAPRIAGFYQWQVPFGVVSPVQEMALIARRHMLDHGTTEDHFGEVACAARSHAVHNPHALMREPHDARRPSRVALRRRAAARARLLSRDRRRLRAGAHHRRTRARSPPAAGSRARRRPVRRVRRITIRTTGSRSTAGAGSRPPPSGSGDTAGVRPGDVDAAMLYDHFTPMVLSPSRTGDSARPGEGGPFVEGGAIRWPDRAPAREHPRRPALRGVHPRVQQSAPRPCARCAGRRPAR